MGKVNYVCTKCGRGFTTGSAARRHVLTVEDGKGMAVTEADYRVGLVTGVFLPPLPGKAPTYKKKDGPDWFDTAIEEFNKGLWRKFGELTCESMWKDDKNKQMMKDMLLFEYLRRTKGNNGARQTRLQPSEIIKIIEEWMKSSPSSSSKQP